MGPRQRAGAKTMEAMILSGLLAVFGAAATWATRPAVLTEERVTRREGRKARR